MTRPDSGYAIYAMTILKDAIRHYEEQHYAQALALFEQAAAVYGRKVVDLNIRLCRKALGSADPLAVIPDVEDASALDPSTRFLLASVGKLALSDQDRRQCLEHYAQLTKRKSEDAEVKPVEPIPADWPCDLVLAPLPESTNDFRWNAVRKRVLDRSRAMAPSGLSVVVSSFDGSEALSSTLACLAKQKTHHAFEVVVVDGGREELEPILERHRVRLDLQHVRFPRGCMHLGAARNRGIRRGRYGYLALLESGLLPDAGWVDAYLSLLVQDDDVVLFGAAEVREYATRDERHKHCCRTDELRLCDTPYQFFHGANAAFARKWLERAGGFDEELLSSVAVDQEFAYRLYRHGSFFRAVSAATVAATEAVGIGTVEGIDHRTSRGGGVFASYGVAPDWLPDLTSPPAPLLLAKPRRTPLVSIYIPAYNCAQYIVRCVDSALNQTVTDLEVCICNDGSTDDTLAVLEKNYGRNPRVRYITQANGGIAHASNVAVRMARGHYIGQLDSDDYLEPDAVELCLEAFRADHRLACVYTAYRNVKPDSGLIANAYNFPVFSRERLTTTMIAHHFRMFTARAWNLTAGFDESMANAVDYDMYLKLSEVGPFKHLNKICYNRILHGQNTSIKKAGLQKTNHFIAVNNSLRRQNLTNYIYEEKNPSNKKDRLYKFTLICADPSGSR